MIVLGIVCGLPLAIFGGMIGFSIQGFFAGGLDSRAGVRAVAIYFIAVILPGSNIGSTTDCIARDT